MSRLDGRGPQTDAKQAAADAEVTKRAKEVYQAILSRAPEHDLVPSLDRIAAVVGYLGDPQQSFDVVHVTGTNGKTSTTRMVERLLREHGLRTGRFTSPHLRDVRERISLDGEPLSPERFIDVYDEVIPYVELVDQRSAAAGEPRMTFFEVLVAMGYAAFADTPVDVAAVEVGMGGSWDATNVVAGKVAVVTPIAIDHQRFLGYDVASIAGEKSGIIKPGAVAVLAEQPEDALQVLLARAAEVGATVVREGYEFEVVGREVAVGGQLLNLRGLNGEYEGVFLPLHGAYQAQNAVLALAAVEALLNGVGGAPLDGEVVAAAFADVTSPGRLEVVRTGPTILVDSAHNPAGAEALVEAVRESFSFEKLVGVVAILEDKDAEGILAALEPVLSDVVVTRTSSARSMMPLDLAEIAEDIFGQERVHTAERLDTALDMALGLSEYGGQVGGGLLATGSVTMAADVRHLLRVDEPTLRPGRAR